MIPKNVARRNVEVSEEYTAAYMKTVFSTMARTMEPSQAVQQKVDVVVQEVVSNQMELTIATLRALQRQVEALNVQVDEMMKKQAGI